MMLSHKITLDPNNAQRTYFKKASGVARFSYNWALAEWDRQYKAGLKPNEANLRKQLNSLKLAEFPWMKEVTKNAPQQAVKNLGTAFHNFFEKRGKYPKFKKKSKNRDSFRADGGTDKNNSTAVKVKGNKVKLPRIGWVRMTETLRFEGKITSAIVSRTANKWYVSLSVELESTPQTSKNQAVCGVDLGIKTLATISDGTKVLNPKALSSNLNRLRFLSRNLSRKIKGSANRRKAAQRIAQLHARISDIRKDCLHKLTTMLVSTYGTIVIEDLNVSGMVKNPSLSRAISDVGFGEFRRQLEYKAEMRGNKIIIADRFYASSKLCSSCGWKNAELKLSEREWTCHECGIIHDRDLNASMNLRNLAGSFSVLACGELSSGVRRKPDMKLNSVKQEPNSRYSSILA